MRRTITKTAASIGLVIAFVAGAVALAARPAAAGPVPVTHCLGLDVVTARIAYSAATGAEVPDPSGESINILFPPNPDIEACGPFIGGGGS